MTKKHIALLRRAIQPKEHLIVISQTDISESQTHAGDELFLRHFEKTGQFSFCTSAFAGPSQAANPVAESVSSTAGKTYSFFEALQSISDSTLGCLYRALD